MLSLSRSKDGSKIFNLIRVAIGGLNFQFAYPFERVDLISQQSRCGNLVQGDRSKITGNTSVSHYQLNGNFFAKPIGKSLVPGTVMMDCHDLWRLNGPHVVGRSGSELMAYAVTPSITVNSGLCPQMLEYFECEAHYSGFRIKDTRGRDLSVVLLNGKSGKGFRTRATAQARTTLVGDSSSSFTPASLQFVSVESYAMLDSGDAGRVRRVDYHASVSIPVLINGRCTIHQHAFLSGEIYTSDWPDGNTLWQRSLDAARIYVKAFLKTVSLAKWPDLSVFRVSGEISNFGGNLNSWEDLYNLSIEAYQATYEPPNSERDWGELTLEAVKSCKYTDANLVAFAKDLPETLGEVKALVEAIREPKNPKKWASLFLSSKYGTRLTIADLKDILSGISRKSQECKVWLKTYNVVRSRADQTCRWMGGQYSRSLNYRIYYRPYDSKLLKFIKTMMDWDAWIDLQNAWDLIPLSFVVDWIVNVEAFLDDFDAINYTQYLEVLEVLRSTKDICPLGTISGRFGLSSADGALTCYSREISHELDLPVPQIGVETPDLKHLPELGSIIIQLFG